MAKRIKTESPKVAKVPAPVLEYLKRHPECPEAYVAKGGKDWAFNLETAKKRFGANYTTVKNSNHKK